MCQITNPELLNLGGKLQDIDLAHFLDNGKTFLNTKSKKKSLPNGKIEFWKKV